MTINSKCCTVESCTGRVIARGYCRPHYASWWRHGDPEPQYVRFKNKNGAGSINVNGYRIIMTDGVSKYEHIAIAEKALGKPLPPGARVHHVTENRSDNHGPFKLVICPSQSYHNLMHKLMLEKGISFKEGWPNAHA